MAANPSNPNEEFYNEILNDDTYPQDYPNKKIKDTIRKLNRVRNGRVPETSALISLGQNEISGRHNKLALHIAEGAFFVSMLSLLATVYSLDYSQRCVNHSAAIKQSLYTRP